MPKPSHLELLSLGTRAVDPHRLVLALGGGYTLENLQSGCGRLPIRDQLVLRQQVANFAPWLKWRGLVTNSQFADLWSFATDKTPVLQISPASRARLEHSLATIDRTNNYHNVQCNALFMLALGLGIHPRHAYTLTLLDIARIRSLLKSLHCYTQWAWTYIDKLVTNRGAHLRKGRYVPQLFITYGTGVPIDLATAHGLASRWKSLYSLNAREAILAHRTMAVEFAGNRRAITTLYKEIFTANEKHPGRYSTPSDSGVPVPATTPEPDPGGNATITHPYWDGTARDTQSLKSISTALQLATHRHFVRYRYLVARRDYDHRQYLLRSHAEPLDSHLV